MTITITNKKICDFYEKYPDINIENLICNVIDIIDNFAGNYNNISEDRIIESISSIKNTIGDMNNNTEEKIKSIFKLNSYENVNNISKNISELITNNRNLITKDNEITFQKMVNILPKELIDEMKEYFGKNKVSAYIGKHSENNVELILNNIFPDAEISNMSKTNHSGDFHLKRLNKDAIIIENKCYKKNVNYDSVEQFHNDCKDLNMHGIMISHDSGISTKNDWCVEIIDNNILVYLTFVKYDACKIKSAVSLIDNLSLQLNNIVKDEEKSVNIDQYMMSEINDELSKFIISKQELFKVIMRNEKSLKDAVENIKLPKLTSFFAGKCKAIKTFECPYCSINYDSKASLGSHTWRCSSNPDKKVSNKKSPKNKKEKKVISIETKNASSSSSVIDEDNSD